MTIEQALRQLIRARWLVCMILLVMVAVAAAGALRLEFNADARAYFSLENPDRRSLEDLESRHGRYGNVVVMLQPERGDIFTTTLLQTLADTATALRDVSGVASVRSILDAKSLPRADDQSLAIASEQDVGFLRVLWERDRDLFEPFVSDRADVTALHILIGAQAPENLEYVRQLRELVDGLRAVHPDITFRVSGDAVMDATFMEAIRQDLVWLAPLQGIAIVLLLLASLRCFWTTVSLLIVLGCATVLTLGTAGWLGLELNGVTSATPMILLGLAVATCIHLLTAWQQVLRSGGDRVAAFAESVRQNAFPVALAVLSTVVSFLCLNFSDSPPFRELGNLIALGLVLTGILAFTLLPILVISLPTRSASSRVAAENAMAGLGRMVAAHPLPLVVALLATTLAASYGVTQLTFDDKFSEYFSERFEFRRDTDFMERHFAGLTVLEYSLPADSSGSAAASQYLAAVGQFATWLDGQDEVDSVVDFAALAAEILRQDPRIPSTEGRPASVEAADMLLNAYRAFAAGDAALERLLSAEGSHTLLRVVLRDASSRDIRAFADRADAWLGANQPAIAATSAGMSLLAANLSLRNAKGMLYGTVVALGLVSLILLAALRSLRLGILSLVPNLIPMLVAYGAWGAIVGEVSFAATVVLAMTFGIVVDDTVHVLAKYNRLRRKYGLSVAAALPESFRTVGIAVTATTVSIASGFAALSFSGFLVNRHLGLLTLMVLIAALVTVLFLLPPLLVLFDRRRGEAPRPPPISS